VISIADKAFYNCTRITSVNIPESVSSIGSNAFYGCSGLTSVQITDLAKWCKIRFADYYSNPLYYAKHLNMNGSEITALVIPDGVTTIGNYAFFRCTSLTSLTIPNSVTSIGSSAFYSCSGLTFVVIPESVTSIGEDAFYYCVKLSAAYISDLTNWCKIWFANDHSNPLNNALSLFVNGSKITDLIIPDGVDSIRSYAFYGCRGFNSVTIPNSVTSIGRSAFYGCKKVSSITIPESVISIGYSAFYGCSGLISVTIPNSVITIGDKAFYYCNGITSVAMGNSVKSIGNDAFCYCFKLNTTHISDLAKWCKIRFANYYSNPFYYATHLYMNGAEVTDLVIPDGVESIGNYAFYNCTGLTSVTIPNSVAYIGDNAFYKCSGLKSLTIGNSVSTIGEYAFFYCAGLAPVYIPETVDSIGYYAFKQVDNIIYYGSATGAPWGAKSMNGYIDGYFVFEDETKTRLLSCSSDATGDISIPNSVTSIADNAFNNCSNITSITIPIGVVSIGSDAFYYCSGLNAVHITDLAKWCKIRFANNYSNPLNYAGHLYVNGSEITDLIIPDGVDSIGNYAFINGDCFTSVILPKGITLIEDYAFYNCGALENVYCKAITPPSIGERTFGMAGGTDGMWFVANGILFVPNEAKESYQSISAYTNAFTEIKGFSDVIEITETTAQIIWLPDHDVTQYTINVYHAGTSIARYLVDGHGQIISSQRFAPDVHKQKMDTTQSSTEYFTVSVDDLEPGTDYTYTIEGTNNQQDRIYHEEGIFTTRDDSISEIEGYSEVVDIKQTSAKIIWLPNQEVVRYSINVYQAETPIARYVVDSAGLIVSSQRYVLRDYMLETDTTQNCSECIGLCVSGLDAKTKYTYTIVGTNIQQQKVYQAEGGFTTLDDTVVVIDGYAEVVDITQTSAKITWIPNQKVVRYSINVYQAETLIVQYIVDDQGSIVSYQRFAHAVYMNKMDSVQNCLECFELSVNGLNAGTEYTYIIEGINNLQQKTYHAEGVFATLDDSIEENEGFSFVGVITDTYAKILWLPDEKVSQYIVHVSQADTTVAQYVVDSIGEVTSLRRDTLNNFVNKAVPVRGSAKYYFSVTLDNLRPETDYTYTIAGTYSQQVRIYYTEGAFRTKVREADEEDPMKVHKISHDGQIYIIRGAAIYDTQGRLIDIK
jgi:uncharacterized protein (UPF0248 family)